MSTTTVTRCDFCGAKQIPSDKERWGILIIGRMERATLEGTARDICPVDIARLRQVAGDIPLVRVLQAR